ncbi:amidohydrolase/deacetylase family metallohydrolase, partial [Chloroflexota bacterium]
MYDLVVKGAKVIDPSQELSDILDIGIQGNKIAAIEKEIPPAECGKVIDARDKIATPGLIDLHSHLYQHVIPRNGIAPDIGGVKAGVTTMVDAGSSGCITFPGLRNFIISPALTSVYCFLHI